ncbi:molybdopterin-dependent oxidoreductase, partial [Bacillus thuringiensis]|nr:molybdopterin-dependent oxidoreductase [Bacillus thuringiensis]
LHPLKRMPDGGFVEISIEQALQEISAKLIEIEAEDGGDAIAAYRGTGGFFTTSGLGILSGFLAAFGSHKLFTTLTIDQSAKVV